MDYMLTYPRGLVLQCSIIQSSQILLVETKQQILGRVIYYYEEKLKPSKDSRQANM